MPNVHVKLNFDNNLKINNKNQVRQLNDHKIIDSLKKNVSKIDKSKNLKLSMYEIFLIMICTRKILGSKLNIKYQLYTNSKKILTEYLDISNILNRFEEMEKLKLVILNNEQLAMFQFIDKESFTLNDIHLSNSKIHELKNLSKNKEKLITILYEYCKNQHDFEKNLNKKLYSMIDSTIKAELDLVSRITD